MLFFQQFQELIEKLQALGGELPDDVTSALFEESAAEGQEDSLEHEIETFFRLFEPLFFDKEKKKTNEENVNESKGDSQESIQGGNSADDSEEDEESIKQDIQEFIAFLKQLGFH